VNCLQGDVQDVQLAAELNVLNELHSIYLGVSFGSSGKAACNMATMNRFEYFPAE
jgi:hypothetical protein